MKLSVPTILAACSLLSGAATAQAIRIGAVDFYGIRAADRSQIARALGIHAGDTLVIRERADLTRIEQRVLGVSGVKRAYVAPVCCESGSYTLYVGIDEGTTTGPAFRAAPAASIRLPEAILKLGEAFDAAMERAIIEGKTGEDESQGHALSVDTAVRKIQERFLDVAARDASVLRDVLRSSARAGDRALAAQILAYAHDKRAVVGDLVDAMHDADESVRNAATRALWVISSYAQKNPQAGLTVPYAPFIDLLNSLVWTDVNKSSLALMALSERRDPALMTALRARARPVLTDVARWKSPGHSTAGLVLLGRMDGLDEQTIGEAVMKGDKQRILGAR